MTETNKFSQKANFIFVGKLTDTDVSKVLKVDNYGRERLTLNITDGKMTEKVEVFTFGQQDTVSYRDTKNNYETVEWAERNNPSVIKQANYYSQFNLCVTDTKTFICSYDFIKALTTAMTNGDLTDKNLKFKGTVEWNLSADKKTVYRKYNLTEVTLPDGKKDVVGFKLLLNTVFKKDALSVNEKDKVMKFNGFVQSYMKLDGESNKRGYMIPQEFIIHYAKNPVTEPLLKKMYETKLVAKENELKAVLFECELFKGATETKVGELTEEQKLYIQLGLLTEEEAIENNTVKNDFVASEIHVIRPLLVKSYSNTTLLLNDEDNLSKMVFDLEGKKADQVFNDNEEVNLFSATTVSDADLEALFN